MSTKKGGQKTLITVSETLCSKRLELLIECIFKERLQMCWKQPPVVILLGSIWHRFSIDPQAALPYTLFAKNWTVME